jgi:hypothetical protein
MAEPLFDYNDTVCVRLGQPAHLRPGEPASVFAVERIEDRWGEFLEKFPNGVVYGIEFEGGDSLYVEEHLLQRSKFPSEMNE